jgi:hypothetical protein
MRLATKHQVAATMVLSVLAWSGRPALAQTTATWFDINPSSSNLDSSDPNGASGGRVHHVGAASDFSRVYAATEWGGLYQSFDQGNTWVRVHSFSPSATWDVKVDPANNQRVYVTSFFDGRVNPRSGISISDDAGDTWRTVAVAGANLLNCATPQAVAEPSGWQIAINGAAVFAGTNCGLARSQNTGANWDFIDPSPGDAAEQVFAVIAHGSQIVDVISGNGHFRSTNNGGSWTPVPAGPGPVAGNSGAGSTIAVSPAESYVLLAADVNDIFESQNGGTTWPTSLTLPLLNGQSNKQGRIPFIKTNQLSTSSQFDVWFGDVNLFKTTAITPSTAAPGGAQRTPQNAWTNMQDQGHWDVGDVMFDPRFRSGACPSLFTSDGGVYRNTRRTNPICQRPGWDQPTITPHATWLWGFDGVRWLPGIHALTYGLQDDGGYAATVVAEGHNPPTPNWNNYTCCDIFDNSSGAGRIMDIEGFFTTGRGFRWFRRDLGGGGSGEIPNYPSAQGLNAFFHARQSVPFGAAGYAVNIQDGAGPAVGTTGDVYFTNNINSSPIAWTSLNSPFSATTGLGSVKIANLGGRPNVYYHTGNGNPENRGRIFRSTLVGTTAAPGTNWVPLSLPVGVGSVTAWDVDPTNGDRAIISGITTRLNTFEIHMTQDFGANWTRLAGLENLMLAPAGIATYLARTTQGPTPFIGFGTYWQPSLFKFNPLDPTTIIAGAMDAGVFLSLNDGANWQAISNPTDPTSNSPHIPRPLYAYFSPGRFAASTNAFDVWVGSRGAGVQKVVLETPR